MQIYRSLPGAGELCAYHSARAQILKNLGKKIAKSAPKAIPCRMISKSTMENGGFRG